jgi:hypothetical protein
MREINFPLTSSLLQLDLIEMRIFLNIVVERLDIF